MRDTVACAESLCRVGVATALPAERALPPATSPADFGSPDIACDVQIVRHHAQAEYCRNARATSAVVVPTLMHSDAWGMARYPLRDLFFFIRKRVLTRRIRDVLGTG